MDNKPSPTKTPAATQNPSKPISSSSATKRTVVAVMTVVVDGKTSLSSHTTVVDEATADSENNGNESDNADESQNDGGEPYTSTIVQDGSTVVVTGMLSDGDSQSSDAPPSLFARNIGPAAALGSVVAIAIAALF
ncbi:hypothetical protein LPJ53_000442 [Coemansia erecta]|uniref:Uncharacterized protein n=1 Tax=Coemansia erecta TaxID=147472 RepID=A0A9W7Y7L7_9FUNG|nr:hypothetical protein LPJ53_000442 [Coemansia erecta]